MSIDPSSPSATEHLINTGGRRAERVREPNLPARLTAGLIEACSEFPQIEICGFIDNEFDFWLAPNVHEEPTHNFLMELDHTRNILNNIYNELHLEVMGIFHSHPNNRPWPSPRDVVGWPNPQLNWRYFLVLKDDVTEWRLV
jgi:proteasome lid subunit RPN8/RPN11